MVIIQCTQTTTSNIVSVLILLGILFKHILSDKITADYFKYFIFVKKNSKLLLPCTVASSAICFSAFSLAFFFLLLHVQLATCLK